MTEAHNEITITWTKIKTENIKFIIINAKIALFKVTLDSTNFSCIDKFTHIKYIIFS